MDALYRARAPLRVRIAGLSVDIKNAVEEENPDVESIQADMELMTDARQELAELDKQVISLMVETGVETDEQEKQYKLIDEYKKMFLVTKIKYGKFLLTVPKADSDTASVTSEGAIKKRSYRLPTVQLKSFNGDLKQWLGWWSQFEKIHADDELDESDKFQYLCQHMEVGSEARELVESYPQTQENYYEAVEALRERYGRNDLQLQVYVRELLTLVISNVTGRDKMPLSKLYYKLESHLRSLDTLNLQNADPATWLFPLVESSLNEDMLRAWQRSPLSRDDGASSDPPKSRLNLLMSFIKSEVQSDQQIKLAQSGFESFANSEKKGSGKKHRKFMETEELATAAGLLSVVKSSCVFCDKQNHESEKCFKVRNMKMDDRRQLVRDKKLCAFCLKPGHVKKTCREKVKCGVCNGRHFAIMCSHVQDNSASQSTTAPVQPDNMPTQQSTVPDSYFLPYPTQTAGKSNTSSNHCSTDVLLNTLTVPLIGDNKVFTVRLVGDTGSQRSYIRKGAVSLAHCKKVGEEWLENVLFGGHTTKATCYGKYDVYILGADGNSHCKFQLLERDIISGKLPKVPHGPWIMELQKMGIFIPDQGSGHSDIDILLGNDYWGHILTGRMLKLDCGLVATETIFGWTLGGRIPQSSSNLATVVSSMVITSADVTNLWNLEAIGIKDPIEVSSAAEEEKQAIEHFSKTVSKEENGRYVVAFPWKNHLPNIPTNRTVAEKRLRNITRRLNNEGKFSLYDTVFKQWEKEKFVEILEEDKDEGHYLPHRPVFKDSETTPVRPVFDASCKCGNNPSLNDCLYKGPNLLELIPALLLRFREGKIGVSADIRKAFQMLGMQRENQKFQKFLWWTDETCTTVKVYVHKRVVFGINCSPFLLIAAIHHHLNNVKSELSDTASKLKLSFYVDNCVTSVNTPEEYIKFRHDSTTLMANAQMDLRQWSCTLGNRQAIRTGGEEHSKMEAGCEEMQAVITILGMIWDRVEDTLSCDIKIPEERNITKRKILSTVAQVFDPVGMLAPAVLVPKLILQESWMLKIGWDEALNEETARRYLNWESEVMQLKEVKIPRHFKLSSCCNKQVHIFCDASQNAYAAVGYLRSEENGRVEVHFLMAKSRLAPIKKATIPRLELMACLVGARLSNMIRKALNYEGVPFYHWSDSTTALSWIRSGGEWGTFVNNRVQEIVTTTFVRSWNHVPGKENPADLPSRGCSPRQLRESTWWEGVCWLKLKIKEWPVEPIVVNPEEVNAERKKFAATLCSDVTVPKPKFSSYRKNVAVWGWVLRFIDSCQKRKMTSRNYLRVQELRRAEKIVLRDIQREAFQNEVADVGGIVVFKDEDGLLRIRTRLSNRSDAADFVYPVVLPKIHPMVEILISDVHRVYGHAGIQFIMSKLREKYWIIQSRRVVRKVIRQCSVCRRHEAKRLEVEPSSLPAKRVNDAQPFQTTGVDLAGPLYVKDGGKAWVVLYTCAVYRGVFLDVVSSLSTEAFLGSLERFIAIYGRPNTIYSDNGTNFVGANNLFKTLNWKEVEDTCNARQIQFIFNPVTASWWGGWWERLVRTVKDLLKRMLGKSRMSYDGLRTCLAGIASAINDRPLTVVNEDSEDLIALTPNMFIRGIEYGHLPETIDAKTLQEGYKKMKEAQAQLQQRFRKEYLALLVMKRTEKKPVPVAVGDVVLVGADNKKRFEWPLGRIVELLPGADGKYRVARVKIHSGVIVRPLQRLYPLEISSLKEKEELPGLSVAKECVHDKVDKKDYFYVTKRGRIIKKAPKYSQWLHLVK